MSKKKERYVRLLVTMLETKLFFLKNLLKDMGSAIIAYSGGVDSTFLLKVASDILGDRIMAVIARSPTYPSTELEEAIKIASFLGVKHRIIETDELNDPSFYENPPERCYYCKKELFKMLISLAAEEGYSFILDGSQVDDFKDFRPGLMAVEELGIKNPLKEAGLTKDEIRTLSKRFGLPTWNRPSSACLASRFPYGTRITRDALKMVEEAESVIKGLGFRNVRVRHHGDLARIEVEGEEKGKLILNSQKVAYALKSLGYTYVTVDIEGYRTGSMNEAIKRDSARNHS